MDDVSAEREYSLRELVLLDSVSIRLGTAGAPAVRIPPSKDMPA